MEPQACAQLNLVGIGDSLSVGRMWEGEETQGRVSSAGMPRS